MARPSRVVERPDGPRTVWWSDHRSYVRRLSLARHLGVHGVAVWQLASADPLAR